MMKYHIIIFILLFSLFQPLFSQNRQIDSLKLASQNEVGEKKLEALKQLTTQQIGGKDVLQRTFELERYAIEQSNDQYLGFAYIYRTHYYSEAEIPDSIFHYAKLARTAYTKANDTHGLLQVEDLIITCYILQGNTDLAIFKIQSLLDSGKMEKNSWEEMAAYYNIGLAYYSSNKPTEAINAFKECLIILRQNNNEGFNKFVEFQIYQALAESELKHGDYDSALAYCDSTDVIMQGHLQASQSQSVNPYRLLISCSYAAVYLEQNNLTKAKQAIDKASSYATPQMHESYTADVDELHARYYYKVKNYPLALHYIDKTLIYSQKESYPAHYINRTKFKAEILSAMNRSGEAYELVKDVALLQDSLSQKNMTIQMAEMQTIHKTDKLKEQIEKEKAELQFTQRIALALILVSLLLIAILVIIRHNARILKEKNKILYKQFKDNNANIQHIKNLTSAAKESSEGKEESPAILLYDKIDKHLYQTECYKEPTLTRENLASELSTNRRYLTEAIKLGTGKTFTNYIYDLRLEHSARKLIEDNSAAIESIALESGFISRATFNRLFKEKFGMTPKEFRSITFDQN